MKSIKYNVIEGMAFPIPCISNDVETTMNTTAVDHTQTARYAIERALDSLERKVVDKAYVTFHLRDERFPKTAQELVDWIKADEFELPDTKDDDYDPDDYKYDSFRGLRFKPIHKKDREGYEKHVEKFYNDRNSLRLEIQVLEPEKALTNFKKLEKEYLH